MNSFASPLAVGDDDEEMRLHVVCYSGRKEDERPLRFQLDDHEYFVEEVRPVAWTERCLLQSSCQ